VNDPRAETNLRIEKLTRIYRLDAFDCGSPPLNRFLQRHALTNQQAGAAQTYLALAGDEVIGFHALAVGQVEYADAPERLAKGLARHPIPIMLIARLAVATAWQGRGVGAGLLKDAMIRTLAAADIAGVRAVVAHAKDDAARRFYERFDFTASPSDPMHMMGLVKDVRAAVRGAT
jgi:GNAT superfamily N-acetyltransferase